MIYPLKGWFSIGLLEGSHIFLGEMTTWLLDSLHSWSVGFSLPNQQVWCVVTSLSCWQSCGSIRANFTLNFTVLWVKILNLAGGVRVVWLQIQHCQVKKKKQEEAICFPGKKQPKSQEFFPWSNVQGVSQYTKELPLGPEGPVNHRAWSMGQCPMAWRFWISYHIWNWDGTENGIYKWSFSNRKHGIFWRFSSIWGICWRLYLLYISNSWVIYVKPFWTFTKPWSKWDQPSQ